MAPSTLVFFPMLPEPFEYGGVIEQHHPSLVTRSLREQATILCLLDHDRAQRVGFTDDGTLGVSLEQGGDAVRPAGPRDWQDPLPGVACVVTDVVDDNLSF